MLQTDQSKEIEDKCLSNTEKQLATDIRQSETCDNLQQLDDINMNLEQSKLESDLIKCKNFLSAPLMLMNRQKLEDLKVMIREALKEFNKYQSLSPNSTLFKFQKCIFLIFKY